MSDGTKISWSDATWNPVSGCTQVSPGCAHCYALTLTERWHGKGSFANVTLHPKRLEQPLHWKKPRRVFVNSMSDLFHEAIPDEYIDRVFAVMALTPDHTYQILTKRPERMRRYMTERKDGEPEMLRGQFGAWARVDKLVYEYIRDRTDEYPNEDEPIAWPRSNVWLGVTVENQHFADERLPLLIETPAAVRFVSAEPLLEPVSLINYMFAPGCGIGLDWVITGGESGSGRRPFSHDWARNLQAQARDFDVPFFMKQDGAYRSEVFDSLPDDLKVREFPR